MFRAVGLSADDQLARRDGSFPTFAIAALALSTNNSTVMKIVFAPKLKRGLATVRFSTTTQQFIGPIAAPETADLTKPPVVVIAVVQASFTSVKSPKVKVGELVAVVLRGR